MHLFRLELGLAFDDFRAVLKLPKMLLLSEIADRFISTTMR